MADSVVQHQRSGLEQPGAFVDGGAVLLARPYSEGQWRTVRKGWWWHTVGMCVVVPYYPIVALTIWQQPSRQSLGRRALWAGLLTLSALLVVGIPPFVLFSRRWYWLYRTRTDPVLAGVPMARPEPTGPLSWTVRRGGELVDSIALKLGAPTVVPVTAHQVAPVGAPTMPAAPRPRSFVAPPPPPRVHRPAPRATRQAASPPPPAAAFAEPWSSLVLEAGRAVERMWRASTRARGPSATRIAAALGESRSAAHTAWQVAHRARDTEAALQAIRVEAIEQRLAALEASGGDPADVEAVRHSLTVQKEAAARMRASLTRLLGQLERLVAQLCEAATHADELALGTVPHGDQAPGLTNAIDGLVAIRTALETVEAVDATAS